MRLVAWCRQADIGRLRRVFLRFDPGRVLQTGAIAVVRLCGSPAAIVFAPPQVGDLARDLHDLVADAGDLGLPMPLSFDVELAEGSAGNIGRLVAKIAIDLERAIRLI
jgi:hypothetical protein